MKERSRTSAPGWGRTVRLGPHIDGDRQYLTLGNAHLERVGSAGNRHHEQTGLLLVPVALRPRRVMFDQPLAPISLVGAPSSH